MIFYSIINIYPQVSNQKPSTKKKKINIKKKKTKSAIKNDGKIDGLWCVSVISYFCVVGAVWSINFVDTKYWSLFTLICYSFGTVFLFYPSFVYVWNIFPGPL
jgi:hypothetical protein